MLRWIILCALGATGVAGADALLPPLALARQRNFEVVGGGGAGSAEYASIGLDARGRPLPWLWLGLEAFATQTPSTHLDEGDVDRDWASIAVEVGVVRRFHAVRLGLVAEEINGGEHEGGVDASLGLTAIGAEPVGPLQWTAELRYRRNFVEKIDEPRVALGLAWQGGEEPYASTIGLTLFAERTAVRIPTCHMNHDDPAGVCESAGGTLFVRFGGAVGVFASVTLAGLHRTVISAIPPSIPDTLDARFLVGLSFGSWAATE